MSIRLKLTLTSSSVPGINQRGTVIVLVALMMATLIGIGGLAVDISNLVVARQELRNAADAGALAGARCLYNDGKGPAQGEPDCEPPSCTPSSTTIGDVNSCSNLVASNAAIANMSRQTAVEVNSPSTNINDVRRGHWSWGRGTSLSRGFTGNDSLARPVLQGRTEAQLDDDTAFINAVKVTTRRQVTKVGALLSKVLGVGDFEASASAVAWIGFAQNLLPGDVDQPLAICKDKLLSSKNGEIVYDCKVGRVIPENAETGSWTDLTQVPTQGQCHEVGAGSANDLKALVTDGGQKTDTCSPGNPNPITFGDYASLNNGATAAWNLFSGCWEQASNREKSWAITLPVLDCLVGQTTCRPIVGAVNVEILWIQDNPPDSTITCEQIIAANKNQQNTLRQKAAPCKMDDWPANADPPLPANSNGNTRWDSFAKHFGLMLPDGHQATTEFGGWRQPTAYLKPSCTVFEPTGDSGDDNYGVLAKIPKLVQ